MTNREYKQISIVRKVLADTLGLAPAIYSVRIIGATGPYIKASVMNTVYTICGEELTGIFTDNAMYIPEHYETEER